MATIGDYWALWAGRGLSWRGLPSSPRLKKKEAKDVPLISLKDWMTLIPIYMTRITTGRGM